MVQLMKPFVHNNGTSRAELVKQRTDTMDAIYEAMGVLARMAPHMRDYYMYENGAERHQADRLVYSERFALLDKMRNELQDEALAIQGEL